MCAEANTSMEIGQKLLFMKHKLINSGPKSGFQKMESDRFRAEGWNLRLQEGGT